MSEPVPRIPAPGLPETGPQATAAQTLFTQDGPFPHETVVAGAQRLRGLPGLSEPARHRLHAAFIELAQNIARYSAERSGTAGSERGVGAIRLLSPAEGPFLLVSENPVSAESAPRLAAALQELAALDAAGLKNLHRERRRSAPPPGSLGAGLGLIELHRQACAPVRHVLEAASSAGRPPLLRLSIPLARA